MWIASVLPPCRSALLAALLILPSLAPAHAQDPDNPQVVKIDAQRQIILVTGSTDGLGREVARRLAAGGAHVIVHGRNRERGAALVREITEQGKGSATFHAADFASLAAVRSFAAEILARYERIDVLVNNAGVWLPRGERQTSVDGHELHMAVNYLAAVLLTRLLVDRISASAAARIVNVASAAQRPIAFEDPMLTSGYNGSAAYAQSKLALVMFTFDLAEQLAAEDVTVVALHPATLMDTPMVREAGVPARSTVAEGADAVMQLVTAANIRSGEYYDGLRPARAHAQAYDTAARTRLRALSQELIEMPGARNR